MLRSIARHFNETVFRGPSLLRGSLAAVTTPRTISDLTGKGVNWLANKMPQPVADAANKFHEWNSGMGEAFPSYDQLKTEMEHDFTGPLYEAKTGVGKGVQTGLEVAPSLLAGGEGAIPTIAKSVGAGAGSGTLGAAAHAMSGILPSWAEPVARGAGALIGGMFGPSGARRAVTPLPMSDERLATVNALRGTNPELVNASSAGQLTESPRVAALEARSPRMADLPQQQNEAYTQGVMRQAGSNGMFDTAGLAEARNTGAQLEALRNAHRMSPSEFTSLNSDLNKMARPGSDLYRAIGPSQPFNEVQRQVRLGPSGGNPMPLDMTGQRYGALKQIIQGAADSAPTSHEQIALANARERLNQAFHNSMPADEAERLRQLDQQYSNYKTIENIPAKADTNTVTPDQVFSKAGRGTPLETHATQAKSVMTPLPVPNNEPSDLVKALSTGAGALLGGGAGAHAGGALGGVSEGLVGAIAGEKIPHFFNVGKNIAGRTAATPAVQSYLKNQLWRPGPNSSVDPVTLARILMTPPERPAIADHSK